MTANNTYKRDTVRRSFCKEPTQLTCKAPDCDCRDSLISRYQTKPTTRVAILDTSTYRKQQENAATVMEALAEVTIKELEAQGFKVTRVADAIIVEEKDGQN